MVIFAAVLIAQVFLRVFFLDLIQIHLNNHNHATKKHVLTHFALDMASIVAAMRRCR